MGFRKMIARPVTNRIENRIRDWAGRPYAFQERYFQKMVENGAQTEYAGKVLGLEAGMSYSEFRECVPLVDYEGLKPYIERIMAGEKDVLWPGAPEYFVMSSGTTSGKKYIPGTTESLRCFVRATTDVFCSYVSRGKQYAIWDGKTLPLTGSPALSMMGEIPSARVSGLLHHFLPWVARWNRVPTWETNSIPDFERKMAGILDETLHADIRAITGLPVWLNLLFQRMHERTGKKVIDIWPNLQVMVYGGLQVDPYKAGLIESIGKEIDFVEVFNASEGFFAFEDNFEDLGLLLHMHSGFFYEFMPADDYRKGQVKRLPLHEVETGVEYAIVLNSVGGLFGYNLGDTVYFTSIDPYRVRFAGRLAHFTSAFNEHVIQYEVERALGVALETCGGQVREFTIAPQIHPDQGPPYHDWFIEFSELPGDLEAFRKALDGDMQGGNHLYRELIAAEAMRTLKLNVVRPDGFLHYMKSQGKVGEQHKLPRLKNDRGLAEAIVPFVNQLIS
ncbi:MAG: GH3 auxin-responsive promoter family protein [Bacteroidota bacterium]